MPASVRKDVDICTGHSCWPPRKPDMGSPNVFCNDHPVVRLTDHWVTHCCTVKPFPCHDSDSATGSPNVFANDLPKCRVGDQIACGSSMATGSPNVFIN